MKLLNAAREVLACLQQDQISEQMITSTARAYFAAAKQTDKEDVAESMRLLIPAFGLEQVDRSFWAMMICGALVEKGAPSESVCDDFIRVYNEALQKYAPFGDFCIQEIQKLGPEEDKDEFVERLKKECKTEFAEALNALEALDKYYSCGVAFFGSSQGQFDKGKANLAASCKKYADLSLGCYWLSKLFTVLFDEPILVIELDEKKGFIGKMSGVADNAQLHMILMGMLELGEPLMISKEQLKIVKGEVAQQSGTTISGKWNMYNWEYLRNKGKTDSTKLSDFWIWTEGIPNDISKMEEYRAILLGKPSYKRSWHVGRIFKPLKAEIKVERILNPKEIEAWLSKMINED